MLVRMDEDMKGYRSGEFHAALTVFYTDELKVQLCILRFDNDGANSFSRTKNTTVWGFVTICSVHLKNVRFDQHFREQIHLTGRFANWETPFRDTVEMII